MKRILSSLLGLVVTLGFGACASKGGKCPMLGASASSSVSGGVVVTNPAVPNPGTPGTGYLVVTPAQSAVAGHATFSIGSGPQKVMPATVPLGVGNTTITFYPVNIPGYLPPPPPSPTTIHIWKNQSTQVTVTYGQP